MLLTTIYSMSHSIVPISCSSEISCNVSMTFARYVSHQRFILDLYDNKLQTRLTKETYDGIVNTCKRFYDPCDTEDLDKCVVQEAAKLPNWTEEDVKNFEILLRYLQQKCKWDRTDVPLVKPYIDAVRSSLPAGDS